MDKNRLLIEREVAEHNLPSLSALESEEEHEMFTSVWRGVRVCLENVYMHNVSVSYFLGLYDQEL